MFRKAFSGFVLLSAASAMAAQNFRLGVDYSQPIGNGSLPVTSLAAAADAQGGIYGLVSNYISSEQSYLVKLTPAGDVIYQTTLPFYAPVMAVDAAGNVYLAGNPDGSGVFVEKLGTDGAKAVYQTPISTGAQIPTGIAVDSSGRVYVTGRAFQGMQTTPGAYQSTVTNANSENGFVVRLKADGSLDYATYLGGGIPAGIAVDNAGDAFVTGTSIQGAYPITPGAYLASGAVYLTRLNSTGTGLVYSTFTQGTTACCIALDSADNATVAARGNSGADFLVMRFNAQGSGPIFSQDLPGSSLPAGLALDGAGNSYVVLASGPNLPVKDSVTPCSAGKNSALVVLDPSGSLLQATYIPSPQAGFAGYPPAMAIGANSTVDVLDVTSSTANAESPILTQFSPNLNARSVQLACVGNAANYDSTAISGGELVSLFGQGLGPAAGAQPTVKMQTGFPVELAGVQVTFNGTPGPLTYAQDGQINAIAPWSLTSGQKVDICVTYNGATTNCIARTAADAHPGVFTFNGSTLVVNQNGTINSASNPAHVGSYVTVYATGLGPIAPAQPDGSIVASPLPSNVLPVTLTSMMPCCPTFWLGPTSEPVTVQYAGPAPFEVAGVSQINFVVNGDGWPISLVAGTGQCWLSVITEY
ncbi:MAG TPA: SBBP repeat-containing protein [Bryobacteraceae bacterium]|nr:SBBP repeat-containing protein [Bryobacteraceae bacterium]